jgi:multidrug transporter EmrE-like cation transporter
LAIFEEIVWTWYLKERAGSKKIPKNLMAGVFDNMVICSIGIKLNEFSPILLLLMYSAIGTWLAFGLFEKSKNLVLLGCKHILWALK